MEVASVATQLAEMVDADLTDADEHVRENGGVASGGSCSKMVVKLRLSWLPWLEWCAAGTSLAGAGTVERNGGAGT